MDELQKWTPPTEAEKEAALRWMREAEIDRYNMDETMIRRYLAARETWLYDTPEGRLTMQTLNSTNADCWPCFDLLMATRYAWDEVKQLEGLADAEWFALYHQGKPMMTIGADGFVGIRHRGVANFVEGVCRTIKENNVPIKDAPFHRTAMEPVYEHRFLISELLERMNDVYTRKGMEQFAICWEPEDKEESLLKMMDRHLVAEPGGLSKLSVDLDDPNSRLHYLAHGYANAAYDGYLTPEQASVADKMTEALHKELGLSEDDLKELVELNANLNTLNRLLANAEDPMAASRWVLSGEWKSIGRSAAREHAFESPRAARGSGGRMRLLGLDNGLGQRGHE